LALALADAGADIIGVSRTLELQGREVEQEILAHGRKFRAYQCDFADRHAVRSLCSQLLANHPRIDILVNNAGDILRKPAAEHPDEYWDKVLETNLSAQFLLSREIGGRMLENKSGKIIFIASLLSFQGGINSPVTPQAKAASRNSRWPSQTNGQPAVFR
jgi:2-deoxy-D-gluconate 3-dehydrogenase